MAAELPPLPYNQPFAHLDSHTLHTLLSPDLLIPHLLTSLPAFSHTIRCPPRLSYMLPSHSYPSSSINSPVSPDLLIPQLFTSLAAIYSPSGPSYRLPSRSSSSSSSSSSSNSLSLTTLWSTNPSLPYFSVKTATLFPSNSSLLPPLPGEYMIVSLFHSVTGTPLASLDGIALSFLCHSAVSGLASSLLSLPSSQTLLIIGAGPYIPCLVSAHRTARPSINHIFIWDSNSDRGLDLIRELREKEPESSTVIIDYAQNLDEVIALADIVSCAAMPTRPAVKGKLLKPGAHLDLVGSYTSKMKECDDVAFLRGRVFVDFEVAMDKAGKLVGVYQMGLLKREYVAGTLTELAGGKKVGRRRDDEVTVFKCFGHEVVDLLAAQLAFESYNKK